MTELQSLPAHLPSRLKNVSCPYCGALLSPAHTTKEHVIARRFVPRGTLDQSWNLILQACRPCNNRKSDLEDDLSAVTMQPDAWGKHARDDPRLKAGASRKGASVSRRSRKAVSDSSEVFRIKSPLAPGINAAFTFTSPPQFHEGRAHELARMQLCGLFYLLTYNEETRRGGFWIGGYFPLNYAARGDWGNCLQLGFMEKAASWHPRLVAIAADGFFKATIRRSPSEPCWSWALEWNENYRLVGFFGDEPAVMRHARELRQPQMATMGTDGGAVLRFRTEVSLSVEDDVLFVS